MANLGLLPKSRTPMVNKDPKFGAFMRGSKGYLDLVSADAKGRQ